MGNEASAHELHALLNMGDLDAALRRFGRPKHDQTRYCWDPEDSSDNITVLDNQMKILRVSKCNQSDAIRGRAGHTTGVHVFEFNWTNEDDKIVAIGVATQMASLTATDRVLGSDDQSVGFDMVSKQIYFKDCPVKSYPPDKPPDFKVPETITMVLDLDNGTLSFKSGVEDYGIAMTGLRQISQNLHVAAELNKESDVVVMKYLDSLGDTLAQTGLLDATLPRGPPTTDHCLRTDEHEIGAPGTHKDYMNGLDAVIRELKKKDPYRISEVQQMVSVYIEIHEAFEKKESKALCHLAGEKLAQINGARVLMEYHNFLLTRGSGNGETTQLALTLLGIYESYSNNSLAFCTNFGESGFVESLIKYISDKRKTYTQDEVTTSMVYKALRILHNCAKTANNRPIYRRSRFLREARPYTDLDYHSMEIVLTSLFGIAYNCEEDEYKVLTIGGQIAWMVVEILSRAVVPPDYEEGGWTTCELAKSISNLSVNTTNSWELVQAGAIKPLAKMLDIDTDYDCECALKAIWSLSSEDTNTQVATTPGLLNKINELTRSGHEVIQQSATILKMKLQGQQSVAGGITPQETICQFAELCKRFKASLDIPGILFNDQFNMCYCAKCHGTRGDRSKYACGNPPKYYGMPVGWYKFALLEPPKAKAWNAFTEWHRAFHGTVKDSVKSILQVGEIVPAGRAVLGGEKVKELPGHFCDWRKPPGFNTKQLFLSPSMRYAGEDSYARPSRFMDQQTGRAYNAKVAFQVLIAPGSYKIGPQTISAWAEIDPEFSNQELEWSTDQQGSHVLSGLLVKLY